MAPKRKAGLAGVVADLTAKPKQNGGRGRGQGKKPSAVNAKGVDHPDVKLKQPGLGELLGQRVAKRQKLAEDDSGWAVER